uniref:Triacylglycerol lipase n=1 Tax=Dromaius novaehollandiae TaxID=8790 RepID=A0A8C4JT16_DRONO
VLPNWLVFFLTSGKEICYDRLGCFSDDPPWAGIPGRPLKGLPDSPEHMNTSFSLYTRETGNNSQVISAINSSTIQNSYFSSRRKTSFIIHGFGSTGKKGWVVEMCLLLLEVENMNCIAVDWKEGAKGTYVSAVRNIRVIGAEVAYFIKTLQKIFKYSPSEIHLIGHSLGAHTAGEAGRRTQGIRRITGLDPAGPFFEGTPPEVRLDPSDARLVDVIHSNGARFPAVGLGMYNTTGHLDFYPNGGTVMPGCNDLILQMKQIIGGCHHSRSHEFYFESILYPTGFIGYPCETYKSFESGDCFPCPQEGCPMMGHYADRFPAKLKRINQKYFLNTAADPPFTSWRQRVFIKLSGVKRTRGDINLVFHDTEGNTKEYQITSGVLSQDQIYTKYLDVEINPKLIKKVEFLWIKTPFTLLWARLGADTVNIIHGGDGHRSTFCGHGTVTYGVPQLLTSC